MLYRLRLTLLSLIFCFASTGFALAGEITVSAAASLKNAFTEVKESFEKANPGVSITTNFASSNHLLKQIEEGAPVDIFASADQETMDKAAPLIEPASRRDFAANSLVLIAPAADKPLFSKAEELTANTVKRIAIGNPESVPAGRYARESLGLKNLWEPLKPKYITGEHVRQVLDYVVRGEVEAGFVYRTDALQAGDKVRIVETLPGVKPMFYPIARIASSKNAKDADAFIDFVLSEQGQAVLAKYGFTKPN